MAQALALTENGDLDLSGGGPRLVRGVEAAAGALYNRFSTFAGSGPEDPGEWVYDYNYGVRWRSAVLGRYFSIDEIRALLADVATRTTGVAPVTAAQVTIVVSSSTRSAAITIDKIRAGGTIAAEPITITVPNGAIL
jgi:hypothetical protein